MTKNLGELWSRLPDVVIAFDIDNTLLDPDGTGYESTVSDLVAFADLGLGPTDGARAYESLRSRGDALERIGLGNPLHDRGNPEAFAVLCLTRAANRALLRELEIDPADQDGHREFIVQLAALHAATTRGSFEQRLAAEIALRRFLATDPRVARFRAEAKRVADRPRMNVWADYYRRHERDQPERDLGPLMTALTRRGAVPIVITEGVRQFQDEKLKKLRLTEQFRSCVLITEAAASVPGRPELDEAISHLIDACLESGGDPDPELSFLWHYRCLLSSWESKTPWFYGRCLHALREAPNHPEEVFGVPTFMSPDQWRDEPLRFVMVGDRYDKDVEPLIDVLGSQAGRKIRLQMGKYGRRHPEDSIPADRRPDRTFTNWDSLAGFLTDELTTGQVQPITTPPDIVNRAEVVPEYLERGLDSEYEALRVVASAITEMLRQAADS